MSDETQPQEIDIGHGHFMEWIRWAPVDRAGVAIRHPSKKDGSPCMTAMYFDIPELRDQHLSRTVWQVQSMDPLTASPSLLCLTCGDHGFIRDGRWVPA